MDRKRCILLRQYAEKVYQAKDNSMWFSSANRRMFMMA